MTASYTTRTQLHLHGELLLLVVGLSRTTLSATHKLATATVLPYAVLLAVGGYTSFLWTCFNMTYEVYVRAVSDFGVGMMLQVVRTSTHSFNSELSAKFKHQLYTTN